MAQGDFCTVSEVKQLVNVKPEARGDDAFIQRLVTSVSQTFRKYLNRDILAKTYDELYDGTGTSRMMLVNTPVLSIALIEIGTPPVTRSPLVANRDYVFSQQGMITLLTGWAFPAGAPLYTRVTYNAGFATVPTDIAEKAAKVAGLRYKEADRLGQTSKVIGGETVNFDMKALPADVREVLDNYKRVTQVTATPV